MEVFTGNIPTGWMTVTPAAVSQQTAQGRVHSGNSSVSLIGIANLSQTITVEAGCFYDFSFFAHGAGAQVGFTATVIFLAPEGLLTGAEIIVHQQDLIDSDRAFEYFRVITSVVPVGVTQAFINFQVETIGSQAMDLDDVSFSVS
jgi:hypothetical protein